MDREGMNAEAAEGSEREGTRSETEFLSETEFGKRLNWE